MFHLLLLVCVWIPVQSLRMGYMVGGALCVLYGIEEVCRYLYLLEKRGDECNQPNRRLGETITIFREDEQLQRIQFQALDNLTFYRYCEYKYAKKKRERNWNVVWWEILWSASILVGVLLVDWKKQILIAVVIEVIFFLVTPYIIFRRFVRKNAWLKSPSGISGEYAITAFKADEWKIFVYEDGSEEIHKMKWDTDEEPKYGSQVILVRVKETEQIFTEFCAPIFK